MSAPFCAVPFTTATAELPLASDLVRLTSCAEPNELAAGRFGPDIVNQEIRRQGGVLSWDCAGGKWPSGVKIVARFS